MNSQIGIRTGDPEFMRQINQATILDLLRSNDVLSRSQIARRLKLSKATVSRVVKDLIADKLITDKGEGESTDAGGRRPVMLTINDESKYVVGVDLGTTNTVAAVGNLNGDILEKVRVPTNRNHSVDTIIAQVSNLVEEVINKVGISKKLIEGIGIAEAGVVEKSTGMIKFSPNFNWEKVNIASILEKETGIQVIADNCTRAMALGEIWHGKGKGINNMIYVNVGYGIGSALVINGKVYDNHSEFGHITIADEDVLCGCGKYGCLEAVASGHAIELKSNQIFDNQEWITAKDVADRANHGDQQAKDIFNESGCYLGKGISIIANIFNPDKIIIGGGVSGAGELLLNPVKESFDKYTMKMIKYNTEIELSALEMDAGVYGAITLVLNQRIFYTSLLKKHTVAV